MSDEMPVKNLVSRNAMVTGFAGWVRLTMRGFCLTRCPVPAGCSSNVVSWSRLIDRYTRACLLCESVALFRQMMAGSISRGEITVLIVISAISSLGLDGSLWVRIGMLHGYSQKKGILSDVLVGNSLIDLHAKIDSVQNSLNVFDEMLDRRNLVPWTLIVSGFAMHGLSMSVEALEAVCRDEKSRD